VPKSYSIHFPVNDVFSDFVPREIISIIFKLKLTDPLVCLPVSFVRIFDNMFVIKLKYFILSISIDLF
ncbi:unnamed protein product, partial [Rotaria sp. Silwood2]